MGLRVREALGVRVGFPLRGGISLPRGTHTRVAWQIPTLCSTITTIYRSGQPIRSRCDWLTKDTQF